jgi:hypothetical protein
LRILHELGSASSRGGARPNAQAHHVRLPLAADSREQALLLWSELLLRAAPANTPLLLISRDAKDWIDAIVGEPTSDDFFCLQATPLALPLASEIPYDLPAALPARLQQLEAKFLGVAPAAIPNAAAPARPNVPPPPASSPSAPPARKGSKWFGGFVGIVVVLAAGAGIWFMRDELGLTQDSKPTARDPVPPVAEQTTLALTDLQPAATNLAEAAQPQISAEEKSRLEAEATRLVEAKRITESKNREEAQVLAQVAEAGKAASNQVARIATDPGSAQEGDEDAGLAQIALAQGNYQRAMEISRKWSGTDRFKEILAQIAVETNQLFQLNQLLRAGSYAVILAPTNPLPDNARFKEVVAQAGAEAKLLEQAQAEFALADYAFLQRSELQALQAKPPFQKIFQAGTAEAALLKQAQAFKAQNQPQAARDLILQNKLTKPPFAEIAKCDGVPASKRS